MTRPFSSQIKHRTTDGYQVGNHRHSLQDSRQKGKIVEQNSRTYHFIYPKVKHLRRQHGCQITRLRSIALAAGNDTRNSDVNSNIPRFGIGARISHTVTNIYIICITFNIWDFVSSRLATIPVVAEQLKMCALIIQLTWKIQQLPVSETR